jgi:hypothetical protein
MKGVLGVIGLAGLIGWVSYTASLIVASPPGWLVMWGFLGLFAFAIAGASSR